jgi:small GTP-binding protein
MAAGAWSEEADVSYKVILLGDTGVGKTCLVNRRCERQFPERVPMTVGVSTKATLVKVGRATVELKLWDTAGQEQYSSLVPMFCRNTEACILVADVSRGGTVANLERWRRILADSGSDPPIVVAFNKCDLADDCVLAGYKDVIDAFGTVVLVSAKTGFNVDLLFHTCAKLAFEKGQTHKIEQASSPREAGAADGRCC